MTAAAAVREDRRRVVVVDDDPAYLRAVRRAVAARKNEYDVALLTSADLALQHFGNHTAELLVMDVYMPGTNGIDACRALKRSSGAMKVVLVSSHLTDELQTAALDAGADTTLSKPYDLIEILGSVTSPIVHVQPRVADTLIEAHLEMARNIARRLSRRYGTFLAPEDIDSLATLGLCEAAARFDSTRSEPFLAFAARRIRGSVIDEIRRLGSATRGVHQRVRKISQARRAIVRGGEEPTDEAIAVRLGLKPEDIDRAKAARFTRVDSEVDILPSQEDNPERRVELAEVHELLLQAREVLPPLEATVIAMKYDQGMSNAAIARALALSVGRVQQLHDRGIEWIRSLFDSRSLDE
ncbi:MAG TPA: sigma-70 family RNA polymerase sigma factor [Kofleriaceae bacterium]|jgi:RNA polymerase sigma factor for flagellar operon FliA